MLRLSLFSKLDWGSYIVSVAKTTSKKSGALICFMKFISSEFSLQGYPKRFGGTVKKPLPNSNIFPNSVPLTILRNNLISGPSR